MIADRTVIMVLRFPERFPNCYRDMVQTLELSESFPRNRTQEILCCAGLQITPDDNA